MGFADAAHGVGRRQTRVPVTIVGESEAQCCAGQ